MYAIGGSANPTINSQGNRFLAPGNPFAKEVYHNFALSSILVSNFSPLIVGQMDLNVILHLAGDKEGRFMARRMEAMELEIAGRPNAQRCLLH